MHANMLAFMVIAYLIHPATPLIYGCRLSFANMRTGSSIWGLPEVGLAGAAAVQLAHLCGIPSDVYGLGCMACVPDTQAGYEKTANGLLPLMAGTNMLSGIGALASLTVCAYEQLVIDNEIIRLLGRMQRGITVNRDTLAAEVIARTAAGENYLEQDHTLTHLREGEQFMPRLGFDDLWNEWQTAGGRDLRQRAVEQVRELLVDPMEPNVSSDVHAAFLEIVTSAEEELAVHPDNAKGWLIR
jgi:trimethylamine--corrinoid protein Co-methyltransferase